MDPLQQPQQQPHPQPPSELEQPEKEPLVPRGGDEEGQQQANERPPATATHEEQIMPPPPAPSETGAEWLFTWDRALNPSTSPGGDDDHSPPDPDQPSSMLLPSSPPTTSSRFNPQRNTATTTSTMYGPSYWNAKSTTSESHFYDAAESHLFPPRDEHALAAAMQQQHQAATSNSSTDPQTQPAAPKIMDLGMVGIGGAAADGDGEDEEDASGAARRETEFMLGLQGKTPSAVAAAAAAAAAGSGLPHEAYLSRVAWHSEARRQQRRRRLACMLFCFLVLPMVGLLWLLSRRETPLEEETDDDTLPAVPTTAAPTVSPAPSPVPTVSLVPSATPSQGPTQTPSVPPTHYPTVSMSPTQTPSVSVQPSVSPSAAPTPLPPPRLNCSDLLVQATSPSSSPALSATLQEELRRGTAVVPLGIAVQVFSNKTIAQQWDNEAYWTMELITCAIDTLCMLVQTDGRSIWNPIARSYQGHCWEPYRQRSGPGQPQLRSIVCYELDEYEVEDDDDDDNDSDRRDRRYCTIAVPALLPPPPHTDDPDALPLYYALVPRSLSTSPQLAHFAKRPHSHPDAVATDDPHYGATIYARFLEQATFGTNPSELEFLTAHRDQFFASPAVSEQWWKVHESEPGLGDPVLASWMEWQVNASRIQPSYHRVFWRKRATARHATSSPIGLVTHACQEFTAYRNFAFTNLYLGASLEVSTLTTHPYRVLAVHTVVHTLVQGPIQVLRKGRKQSALVFPDGSYKFCQAPQNFVGGSVYLEYQGECIGPVLFGSSMKGNPQIQFDEAVLPPKWLVNLPRDSVADMDLSYYETMDPPRQRLLTVTTLKDPTCLTLTERGGEPAIVIGRFVNDDDETDYWIHDPRLVLQENTLETPLPDGGEKVVGQTKPNPNSTTSDGALYQSLCANVPRTFQNEASCYLSSFSTNHGDGKTTEHEDGSDSAAHGHHHYHQGCHSARNNHNHKHMDSTAGIVVCGSPGEVANRLVNDGEVFRGAFDMNVYYQPDMAVIQNHTLQDSQTVWMAVALTAPDQLRQRMAWALSQIMVANVHSGTRIGTEALLQFYDIFVRNAFGNYRLLLKEVVYSVVMGNMLNYLNSRSLGFRWRQRESAGLGYPDENLARVMMKLFTIGMYQLNIDGTFKLNGNGHPIAAFDKDDVKEYARVWTGFQEQHGRGNKDDPFSNHIDPMDIEPLWRDVFPKMGLGGHYVGDGYPLCADRPDQHFLKRGAKYIVLGHNPLPELQDDPVDWGSDDRTAHFVADPRGELNSLLCNADEESGKCTYPSVVTVAKNMGCFGDECAVDTIRVVQVAGGVFYEYVPLPCVHQTYYENAQMIKKRFRFAGRGTAFKCADPRTPVASTACCFDGALANAHEPHYWGERVKAAVAGARCADASGEAYCSTGKLDIRNCEGTSCEGRYYYWMSPFSTCQLKAKIHSSGQIAVVHELPEEDMDEDRERGYEEEDNKTFFRVEYYTGGDQITNLITNCEMNEGCSMSMDGYCMCDVTVTEEQAFTSMPSSREEVLSLLTVGAYSPDILGGSYRTVTVGSVIMHAVDGTITEDTIFEVEDEFGVVQLRKNVLSVARLGVTDIAFRNPVQFMSLAEPTRRDAQYEIDAAIDHFLYHKNTAPFLALHLAQRFGTSNPSLRYVRAIAWAFQKGRFEYHHGESTTIFGDGSYGDLKAAVAATLLDREARSLILDADPVHGSLKEPLLKVTGLMRNLEFQPTPQFPYPRFSKDMQATIGQMAYQAPSSYGFFNPYFHPRGENVERLLSPEAEVHTNFQIIGAMNGLLAMVKYGFDRCFDGFGETDNWAGPETCKSRVAGKYDHMSSRAVYVPSDASSPSGIVDELATLMTSGRLSAEHHELIKDVVAGESDPLLGIVKAEQLISSSSAFHSTGTILPGSETRTTEPKTTEPAKPYKALVVLMLAGGCDTYNLVVPHSCIGTNDDGVTVLDQYIAERAANALDQGERKLGIDVHGQDQPCESFAVHYKLPVLQNLYKQGDLSFFLNAGMINKLADRETWRTATTTELFDSSSMLTEAQNVDPNNKGPPSGVLARLAHVLNRNDYGHNAQTLSLDKLYLAVKGNETARHAPVVMSQEGPQVFNDKPESESYNPLSAIKKLNNVNKISSNLFGDLWSASFVRALSHNEWLTDAFANAKRPDKSCGSKSLNLAVQYMDTRGARGSDRDLIYVQMDGWDQHSRTKAHLDRAFEDLNEYIDCFVHNTKKAGLWNNVTLLVLSEFGRTLEPINDKDETGEGWAGHYFALGGAIKGGKVFGEYPADLTGPLNAGNGRMIPTLSWESIWFALSAWLGVSVEEDLDAVFPNAKGTETSLLRRDEVFHDHL